MPARLESPYTLRESLLLYGGGGTGKTTSVLEIARMIAHGHLFVVDNDYSYAYARALETDFVDCADRITVFETEDDWVAATDAIAAAIAAGHQRDDVRDCWVVIDSASSFWDMVQGYVTEQVTGENIADYLIGLRASTEDASEMHRQLVDAVPWNLVKKEYQQRVTKPLRSWPGHRILTAETKKPGRSDLQKPELADWYSHLGAMPAGETRIHYATSTTLYLTKPKRGTYRMTTVKDRNRREVENQPVDKFGMDYLMKIAGWKPTVVRDG